MSLKQTYWCNDQFISLLSPKHVSTKTVKEQVILSNTVRNVKIREGERVFKKKSLEISLLQIKHTKNTPNTHKY